MNVETINTLIASLGFPVVICIGLLWFIYQLWLQSKEREDKLMDTNSKAVATIEKCTDKLDSIEKDIKEIKTDVIIMMNNTKE